MKYQIFSANEWLYPDSEIQEKGKREISLIAARGSYVGCQILFKPVTKGLSISWKYQSIYLDRSFMQPEVYQLVDVLVNENAGMEISTVPVGTKVDYVTRYAPFRVYDVLKPVKQNYRAQAEAEGVYVCWSISRQIEPGQYTGTLIFEIAGVECSIPVSLEIFDATIPQKETLAITNWFSLGNMAKRHDIKLWSEEHWKMIEEYGKLMRRGRQTHFLVPFSLTQVKKVEENCYEFDFTYTEKLIRLFLNLGFTYIEGGHVAARNEWEATKFVLQYDKNIEATSQEGYAFLSQYLKAWYGFLKKNNWLDKVVQHIGDEPIDSSSEDYRILSGIIRKFMPGVQIIDAIMYTDLDGAVDIWVPTNKFYEEHRERLEALKKLGDILWFYTCWNPAGFYLNRFMDFPLLKTRYLHWGNYMYDLKSYLHWGLNYYFNNQDPFELTCPKLCPEVHDKRVPAGDTHIVYPGEKEPWMSMRLEAMRSGAEDYELLRKLSETNKTLADEIQQECMTSFTEVNTDPNHFAQIYRKLLEAVSEAEA